MKALILALRIVLAALLLTLILASGMLLFSSQVKKEEPPVLLGYAPFTVSGNEMTPSLYPGDLAILRVGPESQPGDIVAFRKDAELVLRRVVGTSEEKYITQQEAFGQPDVDLLEPSQVEGVCVTYLPGCGTAVEFLYSPIGLALEVVLALALLLVPALLTGGTAKIEGPLVDYGQEPPAPRQEPRAESHKWYSKDLDDYDYDDDEDDGSIYTAPPRQSQAPRREKPAAPKEEARTQPAQAARTAPARARRGGSHYKPRH